MNYIKRKLGVAAFNFLLAAGIVAVSSFAHAAADEATTDAATTGETRELRHRTIRTRERTDGREKAERELEREKDRDRDRRHYSPDAFRQFMQGELEHLPSLKNRLDRLTRIQAERAELQKQRQAVAAKPDTNKAATIERFHSLLRRDFALSDESRKVAKEIVSNFPEIRKEIKTRRDSLQNELDKANATGDPSTSTSEAIDIRRKIRYVEYVERKLNDLEERPERLDVLTRMLRGVPPDESWRERHDEARTPEDHLSDLRSRRQELQRELRQVEREIELIRAKGIKPEEATTPKNQE